MVSMRGAFDFEDDGRTYACRVEEAGHGPREAWWWFTVSGDGGRYAPFRAAVGDTEASVRPRVVAYYARHGRRERTERGATPAWS